MGFPIGHPFSLGFRDVQAVRSASSGALPCLAVQRKKAQGEKNSLQVRVNFSRESSKTAQPNPLVCV